VLEAAWNAAATPPPAARNSSSIMGSVPARQRLVVVFALAAALAALAALASALRGGRPAPDPANRSPRGSRAPS
jgi:ribose/xylose/arabinose/galactoside ABC-type transport system permease subunit